MSLYGREFAMWLRETDYGVPDLTTGAPSSGAFFHPRLESGAFRITAMPEKIPRQRGNGAARQFAVHKPRATCTWQMAGELHYTEAAHLLPWFATPINSGRTTPWVTANADGQLPIGDLATASLYYAELPDGETVPVRQVLRGCKVQRWSITVSDQSPIARYSASGVGSVYEPNSDFGFTGYSDAAPDATEFPEPTEASSFANDPVMFADLVGGLTIATVRTFVDSLTIECENTLDAKYWASPWVHRSRFVNRSNTIRPRVLFQDLATDDLSRLRTAADFAATVAFAKGAKVITLDFESANYPDSLDRDYQYEQDFIRELSIVNQHDVAAGTDLTVTVTLS